MALICFLSLVMLMSILGNMLVMVAVCKDRQLRWDTAFSPFLYIYTWIPPTLNTYSNSEMIEYTVQRKGDFSVHCEAG